MSSEDAYNDTDNQSSSADAQNSASDNWANIARRINSDSSADDDRYDRADDYDVRSSYRRETRDAGGYNPRGNARNQGAETRSNYEYNRYQRGSSSDRFSTDASQGAGSYQRRPYSSTPRGYAGDDYRSGDARDRRYSQRQEPVADRYERPRYQGGASDTRQGAYESGYRSSGSYRSSAPNNYRGGYNSEERRPRSDYQRDNRWNSDQRSPSSSYQSAPGVYRYSDRRERPQSHSSYSYSDQREASPGGSFYRQNDRRGYASTGKRSGSYSLDSNQRSRGRRGGDRRDRSHEPLSLVEQMLVRYGRAIRTTPIEEIVVPRLEDVSQEYRDLFALDVLDLVRKARNVDLENHELILQVLRDKLQLAAVIYTEGTLELLPDGYGFLRQASANFAACPDDVYVSPNQIRLLELRPGLRIRGQIRPSKGVEKNFALLRVLEINGKESNAAVNLPKFLDLVVGRSEKRLSFADASNADPVLDAIDKSVPVALGQRVLVMTNSQPEEPDVLGKMAVSTLKNQPDAHVVVLLLGKDSQDLRAKLDDPRCEILSAIADDSAAWKLHIASLAFEKAKRFVEFGEDVVLFCDSLDILSQAWKETFAEPADAARPNAAPSAKTPPKNYVGLARCVDDGGSLTVVGFTKAEENNVPEEFRGVADVAIFLNETSDGVDLERSYSRAPFPVA